MCVLAIQQRALLVGHYQIGGHSPDKPGVMVISGHWQCWQCCRCVEERVVMVACARSELGWIKPPPEPLYQKSPRSAWFRCHWLQNHLESEETNPCLTPPEAVCGAAVQPTDSEAPLCAHRVNPVQSVSIDPDPDGLEFVCKRQHVCYLAVGTDELSNW